jgi:hypothetical protein
LYSSTSLKLARSVGVGADRCGDRLQQDFLEVGFGDRDRLLPHHRVGAARGDRRQAPSTAVAAIATIVIATTSSISVSPRFASASMPRAHGYCTCTKPVWASIVIVAVPTLISAVAGAELKAPLPLNTYRPSGLADTLLGALPATAAPSRPTTGVLQVVSLGLQVLPEAACCCTE